MRLIDADAIAKEWSRYTPDIQFTMEDILIAIENRPTIDAVPIERDIPKAPTDQQLEEDGYGAWGSLYGNCPNCGESVYEEQNYCEKCGQRLDWGNGDPNGFNDETVQAMKDATEGKNLSKVYETLDDMYADMGIDCVSVTRCKDCRYYGERMENGLWRCNRKQGCRETIPEGFCGWAVPKGEVEHETD